MGASNARRPAHRAMRRTSGPNCASTPSRCSSETPAAAMNSPHTLRRGNACFSTMTTLRPARASNKAVVAPAGPPPMTSTSGRIAFRYEEMAEWRCGTLVERPAVHGPQGGELAVAEAGAHADDGIVARHLVAADEPHQPAAEKRELRPARLARGEHARALCGDGEELAQRFGRQV